MYSYDNITITFCIFTLKLSSFIQIIENYQIINTIVNYAFKEIVSLTKQFPLIIFFHI